MQSFFQWFAGTIAVEEPWLILGKGPSFALRDRLDLSGYRMLSLNHAVREQPVLVAHVIDLDVIEACADALERNARFLVMPWHPHVGNRVGSRSLAALAAETPLLRRLDAEDRLLWYDLSTSPVRHGPGPLVEATYFSAEAALNLLATAGVRRVRSLGVDGGSAYSSAFEDLRGSTLLANGRTSFDLQFEGFARTLVRTGVDFAPLDRATPARVYVAHDPGEALHVKVLEHSIRRRASLTIQVLPILPGSERALDGHAVVISPRAQVLVDMRPLWKSEVDGNELVIPRESEPAPALILVGAGLSGSIPRLASGIVGRNSVEAIRSASAAVRAALAPEWNPGWAGAPGGEPRILLYPADGTEPWLTRGHPQGHLWVRDLLDGISHGFIDEEFVAEEIARGHVRPSLLYHVEHGMDEPLLLPRRARRLDRGFPAARPAAVRRPVGSPRWSSILKAVARQFARRTRALRQRSSQSPSSSSGLVIRP